MTDVFVVLAVGSLCFLVSTTGAFAFSRRWNWAHVAPVWGWGLGHFIVGYPFAYICMLFLGIGYSAIGTVVTAVLLTVVTRSWHPAVASIGAVACEIVLLRQGGMAGSILTLCLIWNAWIAAGMFLWAWGVRNRTSAEIAANRCPACAYSTVGLPSSTCPECGASLHAG